MSRKPTEFIQDRLHEFLNLHPNDHGLKAAVAAVANSTLATEGPASLEVAVSAEAALTWWLGTLVGHGDGKGLSGAGRFTGETISPSFTGGGTYKLTIDEHSAVLVLTDYFDNSTVYRGSGSSANLVGTYTGSWA